MINKPIGIHRNHSNAENDTGYEKRKQGVTQDKPVSRQQGRKSSYAHDENTKLVYVVKQKPEMKPTKSTPA